MGGVGWGRCSKPAIPKMLNKLSLNDLTVFYYYELKKDQSLECPPTNNFSLNLFKVKIFNDLTH